MKKVLIAIMLLCMCLLCACAEDEAAIPDPENLKILEERALPDFSSQDSLEMINFLCSNRALIADSSLYCLDFDGDYLPVLADYSLSGGLAQRQILATGCAPEYLAISGGRLYYINTYTDSSIESVALSGEDRQTIKSGPCDFLRLSGGYIYYTDADGRFCRAGLEGEGESVLIEGSCFYPYLSGEAVLYQRGQDEHLCLRYLDDGYEIELTGHAAYAPLIYGGRLYYSSGGGLCSMGLDGLDGRDYPLPDIQGAAEYFLSGESLLVRAVADENGPRQWTAEPEGGEDSIQYAPYQGYLLCDYLGEGWRVDTAYNPDGRIRCFILTDAEGKATEYMAGRIAPLS